ncbi:hypothetical protein PM10SUCC1_20630 [Propionigenium maris DSM 9537]|uniref:PASTA domain-containing protein n=1 Tax=Propionigenium maris DSM 9537 TaxID=1123000 RepID=A0A9W6GMH8_9FUSO|nr:hypothetical protein [Propionigenium maris]GLI56549.1 hypothetical protein PM10SUCC1_20630 [Propionigenium maris DSM 9537]
MKKTLLLISCVALMSTMALAKITGPNKYQINAKDEVLKFVVKGRVDYFVGAWWEANGDITQKKRVVNLGKMQAGTQFPDIPEELIYIVGPFTNDENNVKVKLETTPIVFKNENDATKKVEIPVGMTETLGPDATEGPVGTLVINLDTDSAGGKPEDRRAVDALLKAWGCTPAEKKALRKVIGGDIVELSFETAGKTVPVTPGNYRGEATITVSLIK